MASADILSLPIFKTCTKCKEIKSVSEFNKLKRTFDKLNTQCKKCKQTYTKKLYYQNDEYRQSRVKEATKRNRKAKYDITEDQYQEFLKQQNYCCAICKIHLDNSRFGLIGQVDHCHETKKVRGILCSQCNTGLGNFYDNEDNLLTAIQYLRKQ